MKIIEALLSTEFVRSFAITMFHTLWQGALLAILTALLMFILRNHRPATRYAILYIVMMLLPMLFVGTFLITYGKGHTINPLTIAVDGKSFPQADILSEGVSTTFTTNSNGILYSSIIQFMEEQSKWIVLLWFTGFVIFLIRFTGSIFYVNRLKNSHIYPVNEFWEENLLKLSKKIGLRKEVKLAESARALIPMTVGYLKPVILLPVGTLSGVPPEQIEAILLHELAHILRKDYLLNIIQSLVETMLFYHPLTWWLSGLIREEREHICDDLAVEINEDQINYIKALTTMEELNPRSPLLASAIAGSKKKLLLRVKRLLVPVAIRRGFSVALIACLLLVSLIFTLSLNAVSFIPSSFDLKGRESGEKLFNMLPFNPNDMINSGPDLGSLNLDNRQPVTQQAPDTIISKSKSGKVIVKVYTDSTDMNDERELQIFVETLDDQIGELDHHCDKLEKEIIILKGGADQSDKNRKIVVIKSGDSIKVIKNDTSISFLDLSDTSFLNSGGFEFYGFQMPEMPEIPEMPELRHLYLEGGDVEWTEDYDKAMQEYEVQIREMEKDHRKMERERNDVYFYHAPPRPAHNFKWIENEQIHPVKYSENIIRQELRDDGLTVRGKKYVVEIDAKAMYLNGEKQPREIYRKYSKLVESLSEMSLQDGEIYKLIF